MSIPGLTFLNSCLDENSQNILLEYIDSKPWLLDLKRRTQHYGARYDYKARRLFYDNILQFEPGSPIDILRNNVVTLFNGKLPDQCIINEYTSGQSISKHIDASCFGDIIVTVSLGDFTDFVMSNNNESIPIRVNKGDVIVLSSDARYKWSHQTKPVHNSNYRRISITFRTIKIN